MIAQEKRKAFRDEVYWGRPISGFGDPLARLVLVGLAPAAHGANRTGRIFTGDRSGDWLYRALFRAGFANQPTSRSRDDGLTLRDAWVTCSVRCAPPDNKPLPLEFARCAPYLEEEIALLARAEVFVGLGAIGLDAIQSELRRQGLVVEKTKWKFKHGGEYRLLDGRSVLASFHPSQQNTFTGRLTEPMFDAIFARARELLRAVAEKEPTSASRTPSSTPNDRP